MATVTITLIDQHKDGQPIVGFRIEADREKGPEGPAGVTDGMLVAATISRLWRSNTLATMVPVVVSDLIQKRARAIAELGAAPPASETPALLASETPAPLASETPADPPVPGAAVVSLPGGREVPVEVPAGDKPYLVADAVAVAPPAAPSAAEEGPCSGAFGGRGSLYSAGAGGHLGAPSPVSGVDRHGRSGLQPD